MTDLFGEPVTATGFDEFWQAWPAGIRKVAKRQCREKWERRKFSAIGTLIVAHVGWMKTQDEWLKDRGAYICAPLVYLNQERWEGWTPEPERPKRVEAIEVIKAHKGDQCRPEFLQRLKEMRQGRTT